MFIAKIEQKTSKGQRVEGDKMPELLAGDAAGALALVDAGAVEWNGKGGAYGPFTEEAVKIANQMAKAKALRESKLRAVEPNRPRREAEMLREEVERLQAQAEERAAENAALLQRLDRLEAQAQAHQSEGPAHAPKPAPSPGHGRR